MKAWELVKFGPEKNLRMVERPVPTPGPGEVLVRVHAVSLNFRDKVLLEGTYMPGLPLPIVPASDACGEVVAAGDGVTRAAVGDRVTCQYRVRWIDGKPGADEIFLAGRSAAGRARRIRAMAAAGDRKAAQPLEF